MHALCTEDITNAKGGELSKHMLKKDGVKCSWGGCIDSQWGHSTLQLPTVGDLILVECMKIKRIFNRISLKLSYRL